MAEVIAISTRLKIPQKAKEPEKCVAKKPARSKKPVRPRYDPKKGLFDAATGEILIRRMPYTSDIFKYPSLLKTLIAIYGSVSSNCLIVPRYRMKGVSDRYAPGSMLFDSRKMAQALRVPRTTLLRDIEELGSMGLITIKSRKDKQGTIITAEAWEQVYHGPKEDVYAAK